MMELESMAVEMPRVEGHPNRAEFWGVLTVVDAASQRAPSGAKGRRVVLTRDAAEAALPSLIGMALDYAPSYDRHDVRRKVGVITSAEVVGRNLEVGGYLYAKDFPDVVEEVRRNGRPAAGVRLQASDIRSRITNAETDYLSNVKIPTLSQRARQGWGTLVEVKGQTSASVRRELAAAVERLRWMTAGMMKGKLPALQAASDGANDAAGLGMSFEVADVITADQRSKIWILTKVTFTGAAILRRNRAAYEDTWIALNSEL
ncbi:MAG TPA: hypothetical protein VMX38_23935 [Verrucomicrobiae bacterium]|nr:hypothetical protein [Verrucomicrobiae bacterium]